MGHAAATFHGDPSRSLDVIGVTGTNGKTTVTSFLQAILEAAGRPLRDHAMQGDGRLHEPARDHRIGRVAWRFSTAVLATPALRVDVVTASNRRALAAM